MRFISYHDAKYLSKPVLRRWLLWYIKATPEEERVKREGLKTKREILNALVRTGAL